MIAVSMGDPAGIGLEVAVKAYIGRRASGIPPFCLLADPAAVARAAAQARIELDVIEVGDVAAGQAQWDAGLPVQPIPLSARVVPGTPDPANAPAVIASIVGCVRAVRDGDARALVTLPIAKASLYAAGFRFPGHTEFIAELTADIAWSGPRGPVMMLVGESLKVALATIHAPLSHVAGLLTRDRVERTIRVVADALMRDFGVAKPRIALCGLNPHAGEAGSLGVEEDEAINPAAQALRAEGIDVTDATPADSLFHPEARATYDAAIAMYHDQGLIPLKTLHFWDAVNVTLGLPIVRASPDHGTAFAIAGRGAARADSFVAALKRAGACADRRAAA